jgi:hypothetical protein
MTRIPGTTPFPMDRGIEKILRAEEERVDTGPVGELTPAFSPVKPRLEQLFSMPNLEDYIAAELAPSIVEASVLLPSKFERALNDAVEALLAAEEEDPRNAHAFRRARKLMGEQSTLRELVRMYRSALLKG